MAKPTPGPGRMVPDMVVGFQFIVMKEDYMKDQSTTVLAEQFKPCPFCGKEIDPDQDDDAFYPNGTGWKVRDNGYISYHSARDLPQEQWCWSVHCAVTSGGCGAEMSGDTREEAMSKWNTRK